MDASLSYGRDTSSIDPLERVGRWIMINLGFEGLIVKFEEYLGRTFTRLILIMAGAAAMSVFGNWTWRFAVHPILESLALTVADQNAVKIVLLTSSTALGVMVGAFLGMLHMIRIGESRVEALGESAESRIAEARAAEARASAMMKILDQRIVL